MFDRWIQRSGYKLLTGRRVAKVDKTDGRILSIRLTDRTGLSAKVHRRQL